MGHMASPRSVPASTGVSSKNPLSLLPTGSNGRGAAAVNPEETVSRPFPCVFDTVWHNVSSTAALWQHGSKTSHRGRQIESIVSRIFSILSLVQNGILPCPFCTLIMPPGSSRAGLSPRCGNLSPFVTGENEGQHRRLRFDLGRRNSLRVNI